MIKCILFDLDGTLFDCTNLHYHALNRALAEIDPIYMITESERSIYEALPTKVKIGMLAERKGLAPKYFDRINNRKQNITYENIPNYIKKDCKLVECLNKLSQEYILGICTNSIRQTTHQILFEADILTYFNIILTNEDVEQSKPNSRIYNTAMSKLGVSPKETLIFEDAPKGLEAAYKSGAWVVPVRIPADLLDYDRLINIIGAINASTMSLY